MSIVHYYSLCWNEEKILPFVLDYYSEFCEKIVIMDNESDDNSHSIIGLFPNATFRTYTTNGKIRDDIYLDIKNNIWKESRGKADWVIVCDTDEILFHPSLIEKLDELKCQGVSIIRPFGFDMYSKSFPTESLLEIKNGISDNRHLRKCIIFNPNMIEEINYKAGCHKCYPKGKVKYYQKADFKLLHYKNLGLEYVINRYEIFRKRLSEFNLENKLGKHYLSEKDEISKRFYKNLSGSANVFKASSQGILRSIFRK
jgi:hypothetical protein